MIKIIGLRALAVGVIGSFLPMGLGLSKLGSAACWARNGDGCERLEARAHARLLHRRIFCHHAPYSEHRSDRLQRSTGIALNVMKAGGVLNQPSGQLLLAAATVNAAQLL